MRKSLLVLALFAGAIAAPAVAAELPFDVLSVTPVGSWQLRETISTDHKGKQTAMRHRVSVVGEEERNGESYVWIENEVETFEIKKKGERKKKGKTMIVKALVKRSAMSGDPANVVNNLSGLGDEIIMQTGDDQPMKISGGGTMAQAMLKGMGTEINYETTLLGEDKAETPAGNFACHKISGKGSTETKVVFKKIKVDSESTMWISEKVPFGVVRSIHNNVVNGKKESGETVLLEYGNSGAVSKITKEPTEMPSMKGLFGGG